MLWSGFGCLIFFVNSVVWKDNVTNWAPVWCDIGIFLPSMPSIVVTNIDTASHFIIGGSVGIPASSLCIIRRLYYIAKLQHLSRDSNEVKFYSPDASRADVFRDGAQFSPIFLSASDFLVLWCSCVCFPIRHKCRDVLSKEATDYVVQGHRFDIVEEVGCWPATVNTIAAYLILFMWPTVIGMVSMAYAGWSSELSSSILDILFNQSHSSHLSPGFCSQTKAQGCAEIQSQHHHRTLLPPHGNLHGWDGIHRSTRSL